MKNLGLLYAFLGGAIVGCASALLFAPEKGEDLRSRICTSDSEVDQLVSELAGTLEK